MGESDAELYWRYIAESEAGWGDRAWRLKNRDDPSPASVVHNRLLGEVAVAPAAATDVLIEIAEAAPDDDDLRGHFFAGLLEDWVDGIPKDDAALLIGQAAARSPAFRAFLSEGIDQHRIWTDREDLVRRCLG